MLSHEVALPWLIMEMMVISSWSIGGLRSFGNGVFGCSFALGKLAHILVDIICVLKVSCPSTFREMTIPEFFW
jgi:hypothetical protein